MIPNRILNEVCFLHKIRLISSRIDAFAAFVAFVIETEIHSAGFDPGSETFGDILSHSVGYISYHTDHIWMLSMGKMEKIITNQEKKFRIWVQVQANVAQFSVYSSNTQLPMWA